MGVTDHRGGAWGRVRSADGVGSGPSAGWLAAWAFSLALLVGAVADKAVALLADDEDFRVSEDLGVYQDAAVAMVHGMTLYQIETFRIGDVSFIYPPLAGLLMAPMAYIDTWALTLVHQVVLLVGLVVGVWAAARAEGLRRPAWWAAALAGPMLVTYTVAQNLHFGQINLVLMAFVFADLFGVVPARFRGVAIGLAAAVKLTPLGFLLVFLVRRDWWSCLRALGVFVLGVAIGWLVLPADSLRYWTDIAWDPDRGGLRYQADNQSFTGPLLRAGLDQSTVDVLWLPTALLVVALVAWTALLLHLRGMDLAVVAVVGLGIVYASPMSVQHHWFVVLLAPVMLVSDRYRTWWPVLAAIVAYAVTNPVSWFRNRDWPIRLDFPFHVQLVEAVVSVSAAAVLVAAAVSATRWWRRDGRGLGEVAGYLRSGRGGPDRDQASAW